MTEPAKTIENSTHRNLAVDLFNSTWQLLDNKERTPKQDEEMLHMAHASRYHWGVVGTPKNHARGEWQIARVYAELRRYTSSFHHATLYFDACKQLDFGSFDLAFAYEGLARALSMDQREQALTYISEARQEGKGIEEEEDRNWLHTNLDEIAAMINAD